MFSGLSLPGFRMGWRDSCGIFEHGAGMKDFLRWIGQTGLEKIVWMTDVDETLLEKCNDPNDVSHVPGLEYLCERLDKMAGGGFFVITGRDLPWLDKVFPSKNIRASCEYHCLFRKEPGMEPEALNPVPEWNRIDAELDTLAASHQGLLLRKKHFMRSLHYIAVPENERAALKAKLEPELQKLLDRHNAETGQIVGMVDGGKVFDMGPSDSDKGHALIEIMAAAEKLAGKNLIPIYFGDSSGDVPAARAVQQNGGKFIAIGTDENVTSIADFKFKDPAEYRAAIKALIDPVPAHKAHPPATGPKSP